MKAIKNIADRKQRSQESLLRKIADFITHPAMANFTFSGPGSLPTGQAGAFSYGGGRMCECLDQRHHASADTFRACGALALSADW